MDEPSQRGWQQMAPDAKAAVLNYPAEHQSQQPEYHIIDTYPPQPYLCMLYGKKFLALQYETYMKGQGTNEDYDVLEGESKEAYINRLLTRPPSPTAGGIKNDYSSDDDDSSHSNVPCIEGGTEEEKIDEEGQRINFDTPLREGQPSLTGKRPTQEPEPTATQGSQADPPEERPLPEPDPKATSSIDSRSINEIRVTPTDGYQVPQTTNPGTYQNPDMEKAAGTKKRRVNDENMHYGPHDYDPETIVIGAMR